MESLPETIPATETQLRQSVFGCELFSGRSSIADMMVGEGFAVHTLDADVQDTVPDDMWVADTVPDAPKRLAHDTPTLASVLWSTQRFASNMEDIEGDSDTDQGVYDLRPNIVQRRHARLPSDTQELAGTSASAEDSPETQRNISDEVTAILMEDFEQYTNFERAKFHEDLTWELQPTPQDVIDFMSNFLANKDPATKPAQCKAGITTSPFWRLTGDDPDNEDNECSMQPHCLEFRKMVVLYASWGEKVGMVEQLAITTHGAALVNILPGGEQMRPGIPMYFYPMQAIILEFDSFTNSLGLDISITHQFDQNHAVNQESRYTEGYK